MSIHAAEIIIRIVKVISIKRAMAVPRRAGLRRDLNFRWHMNCDRKFMAKKMNMLQVAQAADREVQVVKRQPVPPAPALNLMQLRTQLNKVVAHRRRLQIAVQADARELISEPVKIIHAG